MILLKYPDGVVELYGVYPNPVVILLEVSDRVPPSVSDPVDVTVPVKVNPLTVPVPLTDVTVPPLDGAELVSTPPVNDNPVPSDTSENPPDPLPYNIEDPVVSGAFNPAYKLVTGVVEVTISGGVPIATVEVKDFAVLTAAVVILVKLELPNTISFEFRFSAPYPIAVELDNCVVVPGPVFTPSQVL